MANIKKLALGLLVAVFAFGFSAFKTERLIQKNVYTLSPDGVTYTLDNSAGTPPASGTCFQVPEYEHCYISYSDANKPTNDEFPSDDIPLNGEASEGNGYWFY